MPIISYPRILSVSSSPSPPPNNQATPPSVRLSKALKGTYAPSRERSLLEPVLLFLPSWIQSLAVSIGRRKEEPQNEFIATSHCLFSLQTCIISSCLCFYQKLSTAPLCSQKQEVSPTFGPDWSASVSSLHPHMGLIAEQVLNALPLASPSTVSSAQFTPACRSPPIYEGIPQSPCSWKILLSTHLIYTFSFPSPLPTSLKYSVNWSPTSIHVPIGPCLYFRDSTYFSLLSNRIHVCLTSQLKTASLEYNSYSFLIHLHTYHSTGPGVLHVIGS